MSYRIPILYVCFKRPNAVRQSFESIRNIQPEKLYIVSDGPREGVEGEAELVAECRDIITDSINWECELHTDFRKENRGCGPGMFEAINWLFSNEEMGIVLEDDCVVQDSFFRFMEEMLIKYKDNQRIGLVAGFNGIANKIHIPWSYCFSRYKATWGWASWRRAWANMDYDMKWREDNSGESVYYNMGYKAKDISYWKFRTKLIDKNEVSAWDWQWFFSMACQNQLTIFPKVSLVSNIGFGEGATHTGLFFGDNIIHKDNLDFPLIHPNYICPYVDFERKFYRYNNTFYDGLNRHIPLSLKHILKKILNKIG